MKFKTQFIIYLITSLTLQASEYSLNMFEKMNIKMGTYELERDSNSRCEGDVVELSLVDHSLVLGSTAVFVKLDRKDYSELGMKDCEFKYTHSIENETFIQTYSQKCLQSNKKNSFTKKVELKVLPDNGFQLIYSDVLPEKNQFKCVYHLSKNTNKEDKK